MTAREWTRAVWTESGQSLRPYLPADWAGAEQKRVTRPPADQRLPAKRPGQAQRERGGQRRARVAGRAHLAASAMTRDSRPPCHAIGDCPASSDTSRAPGIVRAYASP